MGDDGTLTLEANRKYDVNNRSKFMLHGISLFMDFGTKADFGFVCYCIM